MTEANYLINGIIAMVVQQEREAISRRTKEALATVKARGVRLGNPKGAEARGWTRMVAPVLPSSATQKRMQLRSLR